MNTFLKFATLVVILNIAMFIGIELTISGTWADHPLSDLIFTNVYEQSYDTLGIFSIIAIFGVFLIFKIAISSDVLDSGKITKLFFNTTGTILLSLGTLFFALQDRDLNGTISLKKYLESISSNHYDIPTIDEAIINRDSETIKHLKAKYLGIEAKPKDILLVKSLIETLPSDSEMKIGIERDINFGYVTDYMVHSWLKQMAYRKIGKTNKDPENLLLSHK